jgi:hypothetical protein
VKTPLLPGLTAGKTACHDPAAATAGFFLNLTLNSPVSSCTRIDELPVPNVSRGRNKFLDKRGKLEARDVFLQAC